MINTIMGSVLFAILVLLGIVYLTGFFLCYFFSMIILDLPVRKPLVCFLVALGWPIVLAVAVYNGNIVFKK